MQQGLEGLYVIEVGGGFSAPMAAKMLADLGATVVKIEPPEGEPARRRGPFRNGVPDSEGRGTFIALNANKRSLVLDLSTDSGRSRLAALAQRADLLIHDLSPQAMAAAGLHYQRLSAANPRLVMLSITPYGLTGPHKDFAASELTLIHGSGFAALCPDGSTHPELPPLKLFGHHALLQAGLHGAAIALAAVRGAREQGVGDHIDLSVLEVMGMFLGRHFPAYTYKGTMESRLTKNITAPSNFFPCADGQIMLIAVEEAQWARLVELMGTPEWTRSPQVADVQSRGKHQEYLTEHLAAWTRTWRVEDLFHACQQKRIGAAPVYTFQRIAADKHLQERRFFVEQQHPAAGKVMLPGSPYQMREPWWALRSPAPRLNEAQSEEAQLLPRRPATTPGKAAGTPSRPLAGVRVLDLSWVWAGPHVTLLMAYLGAEVLKVESSARPDLARRLDVYPKDMAPGMNRNAYFNTVGQAKRSVAINLGHPDGLALVKRVAARSDVVMSNFATGVMDRLGLGAAELQRERPGLIVAAISAFGQTGPYRDYTGYGPLMPPIGGLCAETGYAEDGLPQNERIAYADPNAGIYAAIAILAALHARRPGEPGQVIDVSLWEPLIATAFEGWMNHALGGLPHRPDGNHDVRHAPYNTYRCAGDDAWVAIAVTSDAQWRSLCGVLSRSDLAADARYATIAGRKAHEAALDSLLAAWCASQDRWRVTERLQAVAVPAYPCMNFRDVAENPHLRAREFFSNQAHPEVGTLAHAGMAWKLANRPNGIPAPAPLLGQHTDEVLRGLLGCTEGEITAFRTSGAIE
jgi:crotonobetainyl-CoA:carnitine CoA-transferase CaiB-like acyl-CoA transferase